jgi:uncharacterized protein (DUF305 family)
MWKRTTLIGAGALTVLAISTGCTSSNEAEHPAGHSAQPSATSAPGMTASAGAHNDADVTFAQQMIPHHTQAIEMSDTLLAKQGIDPRVTDLANQIKAAQGPEIQQMQGWLTEWGTVPMPPMSGHADVSGMMSEQDMTALKDARGVDAGKLFLTQMISHHKGAITMSQTEIKDGQYPPAVQMAHGIVTGQQREIDTMNAILASL